MTIEEFAIKLGIRIKALREERGLSQQQLASKCDFEKSNMSRIESGNTIPSLKSLFKISTALEMKLSVLLDV